MQSITIVSPFIVSLQYHHAINAQTMITLQCAPFCTFPSQIEIPEFFSTLIVPLLAAWFYIIPNLPYTLTFLSNFTELQGVQSKYS